MPSVYIVCSSPSYDNMFSQAGWKVIENSLRADLVVFTGGSDVSPWLYGSPIHDSAFVSVERDKAEVQVFRNILRRGVPMAGICRGGQFLNVCLNGDMYQDAKGHVETHLALDALSGEAFHVTSTHHQIMVPNPVMDVILDASHLCNATRWDGRKREWVTEAIYGTEAQLSRKHRVLCFQPHPEFDQALDTRRLFFRFLEEIV